MLNDKVWVCSSNGWEIGSLQSNNSTVITDSEKKEIRVTSRDYIPFSPNHLKVVDDLITLDELIEPCVMHNLQARYEENKIYTRIGPMLVSVNPFKKMGVYGQDELNNYYQSLDTTTLPPHLFSVASIAYNNLLSNSLSQSMVISGESGAGKTEATKYILKFLLYAANGGNLDTGLSTAILATNPILEAFGNAKTIRNDNSSRFGKLLKINFDASGNLKGASFKNYLLESTRVVFQMPGERNFHVFYQMIKGASEDQRKRLHLLPSTSDYIYLKGSEDVEGRDDAQDWQTLTHSFQLLGISNTEQDNFAKILSAILLLGNVKFSGEEKVKVESIEIIKTVAKMIQIDLNNLKTSLEQRLFVTNRSTSYTIPLTFEQALENRDAMVKSMYSNMFNYLVQRINGNLSSKEESENDLFIAVLDIYGFESLEKNSLEQFCINYANEKLHEQFIRQAFKVEQEEYEKQGIPWTKITFRDNHPCINLIESASAASIIGFINEQSQIPKGNDNGLMESMKSSFAFPKHDFLSIKPDFFEMIT